MDHYYENVFGWFSDWDKQVYDKAVAKYNDGDIFVEIGSFKGRSASVMGVNIINSNKNIKFYCVDTWQGSEEHQKGALAEDSDVVNGTLYDVFLKNTEPVKDVLIPIRKPSEEAAKDFADNSLAFVFIDASHDYENIKKDLNSWFPKVKKGGTLAGHDAAYPPIIQALNEFCQENNLSWTSGSSWEILI
jgi:predicted O-methyltransferase YrrM